MLRAKNNQCNPEEQKAGGLTSPDTEHRVALAPRQIDQ